MPTTFIQKSLGFKVVEGDNIDAMLAESGSQEDEDDDWEGSAASPSPSPSSLLLTLLPLPLPWCRVSGFESRGWG